MPAPYPLLLRPVILEKVWGGRRLESLGKSLPKPDAKYGESWELADMGTTSASGAGGGAVRSVIANGELRGKTLRDAAAAWGEALRGRSVPPAGAPATSADFPLLIKFLDASENLSVQVHPSPEYATSHAGASLKTECWYIMDAEPGAVIYKGIRPEVTREEFSRLARASDPKLVGAMVALPAIPGECHNLPSGTVHALGAGVLVAEVQTPSDTTYRLYDWGRTGRELHIEPSLECASFPGEPAHAALLRGMTVARCTEAQTAARLVTTEFFTVDELRPRTGDVVSLGAALHGRATCVAIVMLDGECEIVADATAFQPVALKRGDTALIPAGIVGQALLAAGSGVRLLLASVA
jgi:mannose-6-phosphate isomerase